jgi:predicted dehydrogenase
MLDPAPAVPRLIAIAGRDEQAVNAAAQRYGFTDAHTDWQRLIDDPRIQVFDNSGPNDIHAEPSIAAANAGKHVICEKPLGRNAAEALTMLDAVRRARVKHLAAFNYRFVPAIRRARDLIHGGELGRIYHFRARYLQDWLADPTRPTSWRLRRAHAGSGALGDLGSHVIDLARFLVGEPAEVSAATRTFVDARPRADGSGLEPVDVDDAFAAVVSFASGALGTLEASRMSPGRRNGLVIEVNGDRGSLEFSLERLNELRVVRPGAHAFEDVLVDGWWPPGHILGWEHTFVFELGHFLDAVVNDKPVEPYGATFEDGYRAAVVGDAIVRSAETGERVPIVYEGISTTALI